MRNLLMRPMNEAYELSKLQPCVLHSQLSSLVYYILLIFSFLYFLSCFFNYTYKARGAQPACELHFFVSWKVHNVSNS